MKFILCCDILYTSYIEGDKNMIHNINEEYDEMQNSLTEKAAEYKASTSAEKRNFETGETIKPKAVSKKAYEVKKRIVAKRKKARRAAQRENDNALTADFIEAQNSEITIEK